jgi:hypothetical protein
MTRTKRWLVAILGTLLLLFGLGCLNYTKADGLEHHQEVARRHGLPPPGPPIFYAGVAAVVIGAGTVGFSLGRSRRTSS